MKTLYVLIVIFFVLTTMQSDANFEYGETFCIIKLGCPGKHCPDTIIIPPQPIKTVKDPKV